MVSLELPMPPSTNKIWRKARGRVVRSDDYQAWLSEAGWRLRLQDPPLVAGQVLVVMSFERTDIRADVDNRIKPLLDLLVKHSVIEDDRCVLGLAAAWAPRSNGLARVAIYPAGHLAASFIPSHDLAAAGWFISQTTA